MGSGAGAGPGARGARWIRRGHETGSQRRRGGSDAGAKRGARGAKWIRRGRETGSQRDRTLGVMRCRCTECRQMFTVAASAKATQRVCGSACRRARDRKLARQRRRRDLDEARADERARQRARRARPADEAATAATAEAGCHAPPSAPKLLLSRQEVAEFVDRALARSRATLVRDFRGALGRYVAKSGGGSVAVTHDPRLASDAGDERFSRNPGDAVTHEPFPEATDGA